MSLSRESRYEIVSDGRISNNWGMIEVIIWLWRLSLPFYRYERNICSDPIFLFARLKWIGVFIFDEIIIGNLSSSSGAASMHLFSILDKHESSSYIICKSEQESKWQSGKRQNSNSRAHIGLRLLIRSWFSSICSFVYKWK